MQVNLTDLRKRDDMIEQSEEELIVEMDLTGKLNSFLSTIYKC